MGGGMDQFNAVMMQVLVPSTWKRTQKSLIAFVTGQNSAYKSPSAISSCLPACTVSCRTAKIIPIVDIFQTMPVIRLKTGPDEISGLHHGLT